LDTLSNPLVLLNQVSHLLTNACTVSELKQVRDVAEAARVFAKAAQLGVDQQNQAAEVKLRAERKAGQLLAGLRLRGGDRKSNRQRASLKLSDIGISHDQSRRWQRLASVPDDEFNQFLDDANSSKTVITAAALLILFRNRKHRSESVQPGPDQPKGSPPSRYNELLQSAKEVRNHRDLLAKILRPVYDCGDSRLHSGESRAVGHLLNEMNVALIELERQLLRSKWLEQMNGKEY
jgi:hypothetical protein